MTATGARGRALVTGASIAGAATAYWLDRIGYDVTVLERAPQLRDGGQNVDVRGAGRQVLRRMGLEDAVREAGTGEVGTRFVDESGASVGEFPAREGEDGPTAELEILRGDLARLLVDACPPSVTWRLGDHVDAVEQGDDRVVVRLAGGAEETYDLVVVAEGVGSTTRDRVLGEPQVDRLGMYMVYGTIARTDADDDWWRWLSAPGARQATIRPDPHGTVRATLAFRSEPTGLEHLDRDAQVAQLRERFDGVGWEVPRILDGLAASDDVYVEDLRQVRAGTWSRGRVVLTGDAAWCVTPIGGGGAALALVGAYALAAHLSHQAPGTGGDGVSRALVDYERWMRPVVADVQDLPPGVPALATPRSRAGVALFRLATRVGSSAPVQRLAARLTSGPGEGTALPELQEHPSGS